MKKLMIMIVAMIGFSVATTAQETKKTDSKRDTVVFMVNLHCEACEAKVAKNLPYEKGVLDFTASHKKQEVMIVYNPKKTDPETLKQAIIKMGYQAKKKD